MPIQKSSARFSPYGKNNTNKPSRTTKKVQGTSYTLPAGRYFIGDIGTHLKANIYEEWLAYGKAEAGCFEMDRGTFCIAPTNKGNGLFFGSDGLGYMVNTGVIGMASESLLDKESKKILTKANLLRNFDKPIHFFTDENGLFRIRSGDFNLTIDTTTYSHADGMEFEEMSDSESDSSNSEYSSSEDDSDSSSDSDSDSDEDSA
jgi:hypothetical protein